MNHWLYSLARMFPYWAVPLLLLSLELTRYFHRRLSPAKWAWGFLALLLLTGVSLWFGFRGDLYSDDWVKTLIE